MQRIDTATRALNLFGAGKDGFKDGDLANGVAPTDLDAAWFNSMQEEVANVIEDLGTVLVPGTNTQLRDAMKGRLIKVTLFTNSGTWTRAVGTKSIRVRGQGVGGSGGGAPGCAAGQVSIGSGGSGGSWGEGYYTVVPATAAVTLPAPPNGTAGAVGTAGGTASFGSLMSLPGGLGGTIAGPSAPPFSSTGVSSGSFPTGANVLSAVGGPGGVATASSSSLMPTAGFGGNALGGAGAPAAATGSVGVAATTGGGGGGTAQIAAGGALAGGRGGAGFFIVEEYA